MTKLLLRLIDSFLAKKGFKRVPVGAQLDWVPPSVCALTTYAKPLAEAADKAPQSGEWKRHQVYAKMLKQFPHVPKQDVAWAVERAVQRMENG